MSKGPKFLASNVARHQSRRPLWWIECSQVDVEALRVKLSVDYVRARGGLTYEERQALRARISEIQQPKEMRTRAMEAHRRRERRVA